MINPEDHPSKWILKQLNIYSDYQKPGLYRGNVQFVNGIKMEMSLSIDHDKASKMIAFIQDEIVESAKELSSMIQKSMPLQIEESKSEEV